MEFSTQPKSTDLTQEALDVFADHSNHQRGPMHAVTQINHSSKQSTADIALLRDFGLPPAYHSHAGGAFLNTDDELLAEFGFVDEAAAAKFDGYFAGEFAHAYASEQILCDDQDRMEPKFFVPRFDSSRQEISSKQKPGWRTLFLYLADCAAKVLLPLARRRIKL